MTFNVDGIEVTIEYRNIKNMNLYLKPPNGSVLVTAPRGTTKKTVTEIVRKKLVWINKHQKEMQNRCQREERQITREQIDEMRQKVSLYVKKWEPVMGVHAAAWTLREMKTRWGSCTVSTGKIRLNTRLVHFPEECLEYVLVHELCHLIEPSHNQRFKAYMACFLPDWKERRKRLGEGGDYGESDI